MTVYGIPSMPNVATDDAGISAEALAPEPMG